MATQTGPQKGASTAFEVSKEPPARFFAGLAWDPVPLRMPAYLRRLPKFVQILWRIMKNRERDTKENDTPHVREKDSDKPDLDLYCYIFNREGALVATVGAEDDMLFDQSGKISHSYDDRTGTGGYDDEVLSVSTRDLPVDYARFFFVVKSDCKFSFDEIYSPAIRLADGKSNANILENTLDPAAHLDAAGYVFCCVTRETAEETDAYGEKTPKTLWHCRNIDRYTGYDEDWAKILPSLAGDTLEKKRPGG